MPGAGADVAAAAAAGPAPPGAAGPVALVTRGLVSSSGCWAAAAAAPRGAPVPVSALLGARRARGLVGEERPGAGGRGLRACPAGAESLLPV